MSDGSNVASILEWGIKLGLLAYIIIVERRLSRIEGYCKGRHEAKDCGEGI